VAENESGHYLILQVEGPKKPFRLCVYLEGNMASIVIKGKKYDLRMDIHAMERIEKEFGDLRDALRAFRGKERKISMVKSMFAILANSGRKKAGLPEDVTGEEIDQCNLADLDQLAKALNLAMEEAMHAETVGGNEADDEPHDEYMEELEKNEKNG
jgi:hypothetical protein